MSTRWACIRAISITVAPALTLTDKEYQRMRSASIAVLREIGVETGGSNVQFAVDPKTGRMVVIEMNPRVSRSSALASKATGFPIAKVAARLAVGYTLDEIANDITGGATPASFEPTIDYVVTKIPRFAFEKFKGAEPLLSTSMKSVGEVMAIGRNFAESLQKALRGLETGLCGLDRVRELRGRRSRRKSKARWRARRPTGCWSPPKRSARASRSSGSTRSPASTPGSSSGLQEIVEAEEEVRIKGLPSDARGMRRLKAMGFSDARLAQLSLRSAHVERGMSEAVAAGGSGVVHDAMRAMTGGITEAEVRAHREKLGVRPVFKRIDSCAAEFDAATPYLYSTYEAPLFGEPEDEAHVSDRKKVMILGGGPNRIGQGIEFDYCCCHAAFALGRDRGRQDSAGLEVIMVNCNPETVSTDPDTSDRLYFEPLTAEDVLRDRPPRAGEGRIAGRDRPARRADPAEAGRGAAGGGRADPRHLARQHRPCRGPRALRGAGAAAGPQAARKRHCAQPRRGDPGGGADRLSGAPAPVLRAWRAGHGGRRRAAAARSLYRDRGRRCRARARC